MIEDSRVLDVHDALAREWSGIPPSIIYGLARTAVAALDAKRHNYHKNGDLVVDSRTLFRQVGWIDQGGSLSTTFPHAKTYVWPVYQQIPKREHGHWNE